MSEVETPRKNFCLDLHLSSKLLDPTRCVMTAPLNDEVRSRSGACPVGVLVTMVDVAGSDPVLAAWNPDWTATQDLSVHSVKPLREGPMVVDTRLLRQGKKISFITAEIYDGHGLQDLDELRARIDRGADGLTLCARSLATFTRIPRTAASGVASYDPNQWVGKIRQRSSSERSAIPLLDRLGLQVLDPAAGVIEIANTPYVANSIGTINGGVQAMVMEAAAEAMRPGLYCSDIQMHFLSQLKVGPARTRGTLIRDAADHSVILIQLLDAGADDKVLTTATVTLCLL